MKFKYFNLKYLIEGNIVEISFQDTQYNIMLLDANYFSKYRFQKSFSFVGGIYYSSPVYFVVPSSGIWYVIIELNKSQNPVQVTVNILQ